jgi:hypothetical protein
VAADGECLVGEFDELGPGHSRPVRPLTLRNLAAAGELDGRHKHIHRKHHEALARSAEDGHGEVAVWDAAVIADGLLPRPWSPGPPGYGDVPTVVPDWVAVGHGE